MKKIASVYFLCGICTFAWWMVDWKIKTGEWRRIDATILVGPIVVFAWPLTAKMLLD